MLSLYKKEFLHIAAGDDEWRAGVRSGFDSILETYENQKCMYELFEIVDEYVDTVDNSKEPLMEDFEKKIAFAKSATPRCRQRASSAIFTTTPEQFRLIKISCKCAPSPHGHGSGWGTVCT